MHLRGSWTGAFLLLGLIFRVWHFLRVPSVWHDEAALLLNVIGKNFTELLGPLYFAEAAPPLFLWLERAVVLVLGDDATVLRLLPFLASCASLLLLTWTAQRTLAPAVVPWAVLLFASSDRLLWHCCEAKPYTVDMLVSSLAIALFVAGRSAPLTRQLLLLAAMAPLFIFLSYPACFVLGGLLVVYLPLVVRQQRRGTWSAYVLLIVVIVASFALLVLGPVQAQRHPSMDNCWINHFPRWNKPWRIPTWVVFSTLDMVRYCFEPTGHLLTALAALGAIFLWRGNQRGLVAVLLLPPGLALAAAFLGAYPYGGSRVEAFAAPGLALLIAAGATAAAGWLRSRVRFGGLAVAALLLAPAVQAAYHVIVPWERPDNASAAAYVLSHRLPDDDVTGNIWQDAYYFRDLGPAFQLLGERLVSSKRQWLVMTLWPHAQREWMLAHYAGQRRILDRQDFTDTTVLLLEGEQPTERCRRPQPGFFIPGLSYARSTRRHSPP